MKKKCLKKNLKKYLRLNMDLLSVEKANKHVKDRPVLGDKTSTPFKKGQTKGSPKARKAARTMTTKQVKDFMKLKKGGK